MLLWSLAGLLALLLTTLGGVWIWAGTEGSLATALRWAGAERPLVTDEVTGTVRGGGKVRRLVWDEGGLRVEVHGAEILWTPAALLSRTLLFTCVLTVLSSLQVFVIFQLLTRGGPDNQTHTMLLSVYQNAFIFANNLGLAGAMSMVLFVIILVLTVVQFRLLRTQGED